MKKKRTSIKDIASALNISVTTVSFVLNGKAKEMRISDEVANKVSDYAKEINYTPNRLAQGLRTGKSRIIVFMVEGISNLFFAQLARIIEDIANKEGYRVLFCSNDNEDGKSLELINLFRERQVDGFIITPSAGIKKTIKNLVESKIPVILFDRYFPDLDTHYVIIDNKNAVFRATRHLLDNGYKNIAFVTTDVDQTQMKDRLQGYRDAVKTNGGSETFLRLPFHQTPAGRKQLFLEYMNQNPDVDALFFSTNYLIQDALTVLKENFPNFIRNFGLMAFDDNPLFRFSTPSISAVSQPMEQIGQELMTTMLSLLGENSDQEELQQKILEAELQIRDSSAAKF